MQKKNTTNVGIFVFDDAEVLDFAGPFEVFSVASRLALREDPGVPEPFRVFTVAERNRPVRARGGLLVQPNFDFADHPPVDLLVVPGGVVTHQLENANALGWISRSVERARLTASVCTGSFLLGKVGLLDGRGATTHWEDTAELEAAFPEAEVRRGVPWVDEGEVVTSAGVSAGIQMSLHLVERLLGGDLAEATARQMEYAWEGAS